MYTGMILVDLQKEFDTLNHGVLFEKMKYFGFQTVSGLLCLKHIFFDFFFNIFLFFIFYLFIFFEAGTLNYGVPQDSILELILCL